MEESRNFIHDFIDEDLKVSVVHLIPPLLAHPTQISDY